MSVFLSPLQRFALGAIAVACASAVPAFSATYDFALLADQARYDNSGVEQNWGDYIGAPGYTVDGITVFASGSNTTVDDQYVDAFLDSSGYSSTHNPATDGVKNAGNIAGLGVCSSLDKAGGCATGGPSPKDTSDDNVDGTGGVETLELAFSQAVNVTDILFYGATHDPANGGILIDGVAYVITNGALSAAGLAAMQGIMDVDLTFGSSPDIQVRPTEFYITNMTVAAVPLPASLVLLAGALGGLGIARKRRKPA